MPAWNKSIVSLVALVMALQASAQRRLVIRQQPPNDHIQVLPANLRSTTLYLGLTEDHEAFWNRFDQNKFSLLFRLAQLARTGHNGVRVWGGLYLCTAPPG